MFAFIFFWCFSFSAFGSGLGDVISTSALDDVPPHVANFPLVPDCDVPGEKFPTNVADFAAWVGVCNFRVPHGVISVHTLDETFRALILELQRGSNLCAIPDRGGFVFGSSFPYDRDSAIWQMIFGLIQKKSYFGIVNLLNLGAGHGFLEWELFLRKLNVRCDSLDLSEQLAGMFNEKILPVFRTASDAKAAWFRYVQGNVADSAHPIFNAPYKRQLAVALNLFHFLDKDLWAPTLNNMHQSLDPMGVAVFVMQFDPYRAFDPSSPYPPIFERKILHISDGRIELVEERPSSGPLGKLFEIENLTHGDLEEEPYSSLLKGSIPEKGGVVHNIPAPHFTFAEAVWGIEQTGQFKVQEVGLIDQGGNLTKSPISFLYALARPIFEEHVVLHYSPVPFLARERKGDPDAKAGETIFDLEFHDSEWSLVGQARKTILGKPQITWAHGDSKEIFEDYAQRLLSSF